MCSWQEYAQLKAIGTVRFSYYEVVGFNHKSTPDCAVSSDFQNVTQNVTHASRLVYTMLPP